MRSPLLVIFFLLCGGHRLPPWGGSTENALRSPPPVGSITSGRIRSCFQTPKKLTRHREPPLTSPPPPLRQTKKKNTSSLAQRHQPLRTAARRAPALRVRASSADPESVDALQKRLGIPGSVEFGRSARFGGLPTVTLKHACGSSAEIALFGGCVLSWKQASGDEVLYVRPDAVFDKSKPISGGIPLCWPLFGPPSGDSKLQQHGFARNLDWAAASASADPNPDDRDPEVELVLEPSDYTRAMWPHDFKAALTVALHGETLKTAMRVQNTGKDEFDFTAALHTYIEVLSASKAQVRGLKGLTYLDKSADPKNPAKKVEERDAVTFGDALVDSVYLESPPHVELDVGTGAAVAIDADGWRDTVVWNPHLTMEACYDKFVCVENARAGEPVVLKPGQSWVGTADFSVVDL